MVRIVHKYMKEMEERERQKQQQEQLLFLQQQSLSGSSQSTSSNSKKSNSEETVSNNPWFHQVDSDLDGNREEDILERLRARTDLLEDVETLLNLGDHGKFYSQSPGARLRGGGGAPFRDSNGTIVTNLRGRQRQVAGIGSLRAERQAALTREQKPRPKPEQQQASTQQQRVLLPPIGDKLADSATMMDIQNLTRALQRAHIPMDPPDPRNPKSYKKRLEAALAHVVKPAQDEDDPADYFHRFRDLGGCGAPRKDRRGHVITTRKQPVEFDYESARASPTNGMKSPHFFDAPPKSSVEELRDAWKKQIAEKKAQEEEERRRQEQQEERYNRQFQDELAQSKRQDLQRQQFLQQQSLDALASDPQMLLDEYNRSLGPNALDALKLEAMKKAILQASGMAAQPTPGSTLYQSGDNQPVVLALEPPKSNDMPRHQVTNPSKALRKLFPPKPASNAAPTPIPVEAQPSQQAEQAPSPSPQTSSSQPQIPASSTSVSHAKPLKFPTTTNKKHAGSPNKKHTGSAKPAQPARPMFTTSKYARSAAKSGTTSTLFARRTQPAPLRETNSVESDYKPRRPLSKGHLDAIKELEGFRKQLEQERITQTVQISALQKDWRRLQRP